MNWKTTAPPRRSAIVLVAGMIGVSLLFAACGGAETATPAPQEPPAAVPTQAPPAPGSTAVPFEAQPVVPAAVDGSPSAAANQNTWIYSGPGEGYVVYGALVGGQTAQVAGRSEDGAWWAISVPVAPQGVGWVDGAWVTVTDSEGVPTLPTPPIPPSTAMVPPGPTDPQVAALANTNVRSGPGETYPAYGVAQAGAVGRVLGTSEDAAWWAVRVDPSLVGAGYGWVAASAVQASNVEGVPTLASPPPPTISTPVTPPEGVASATAIDYVNLRSGPGSCFPVYAVAPPGASGEVTGVSEDGQWWQVKLPVEIASSGLGWVAAGYVTTANTDGVSVVPGEPCEDAGVPAPAEYECALTGQSPADYSVLASGSDFEMEWTVVNLGEGPWNKNVASFLQAGAAGTLHTGEDSFALEDDILPGESVTITTAAEAPDSPGTYGELWEINANGPVVCQFWMIVTVE